jgi:hypothetical protein
MRKALYTLTVVLLIGAVIVGCGKKENPFEPITSSYLPTTAMESQGPTVLSMTVLDGGTTLFQSPAYDEIGILFDADINAATVNTSTILVQNVQYPANPFAYTVSYDRATKKAVIKATNGWNDTLSYLVTVTTGVRDIHGHALDGNDNGWVDPQDSKKVQFWGSNAAVAAVDMTPPTVTMLDPTDNRIQFALSDSLEIYLEDNDSLDLTTITNSAFELTTASGEVVTLPTLSLVPITPQRRYYVRFLSISGLQQATDYFLTVKTTIKDMKGNSLDGNGNGISEAEAVDRERIKFRTYDPTNGGIPSISNLRVIGTEFTDANRALYIKFNRKMNTAYLNTNYIKIYNDNDYTNFVPGTITIMPDTMTVKYTLENFDGSGVIYVSRLVRDTSGMMLDENNNGIPGEAAYLKEPSHGGVPATYQPSDDLYKNASFTTGFSYILFYDRVEEGNVGWSLSGTTPQLWHRSTVRAAENPNYGGNWAWYCGSDIDTSYLYSPLTAVHDTIKMPVIDLTWYSSATLYYDYRTQTDGAADYLRRIYRWRNADGTWPTTWMSGGSYSGTNAWTTAVVGIGTSVQLQYAFVFETDAVGNTAEGVWLDNIRIIANH